MPQSLLRFYYRSAVLISVLLLMLSFRTVEAATLSQAGHTTVPFHVTTGKDQGYTIKVLARRDGATLSRFRSRARTSRSPCATISRRPGARRP